MTNTIDLGFVPYEAQEMDGWLKNGHAAWGWRGDPRLELRIGVITAGRSGYSEKVKRFVQKDERLAWNYQVWRHNEDGTEKQLLQRKAEDVMDIIPSLIKMDPRTPGFENVMDTVERENTAHDLANSKAIQEAHGEQAEHLWKLIADRENGPSTFRQMPGLNPDKQD